MIDQMQVMIWQIKLSLAMPIYNLIEYSSNYPKTTEKLWFYEATNFDADITNNNFKSFEYKARLLEKKVADGANQILRNATIAVTLFK